MDSIMQVAGLGIVGAALCLVLKKNSGDMAMLLSVAVCAVVGAALVSALGPVMDFASELRELSGISVSVASPLLKVAAVGIICQMTANFCRDAGQEAIAGAVTLCGAAISLYVTLPLFSAVLQLLEELMS